MEPGDVVLCTVTKIEGTSVFVNIEGDGEGSIVVSEIAPGRIRNLRDYVVPNKKIVCKVLRTEGGHVHLSLRRVTSKEKQDLLKSIDTIKAITLTLKRLLPDKADTLIQSITKENSLPEFFQKAKEDPKLLQSLFTPEEIEKIASLLKEKEKDVEIKKEFTLSCVKGQGIVAIKRVLEFNIPRMEIIYLAASKFSIKLKASNYKEGNAIITSTLDEIEKRAKKEKCEFEILEK